MTDSKTKVLNYYNRTESRLGYKLITHETKHFGYYPNKKRNISERKAQELTCVKVGEKLNIKPGQKLLELGCGYGVVGRYLAKKYDCDITAIDLNSRELETATTRAKEENIDDKIKFLEMDYTDLQFPEAHFDAVYAVETLSHSPDLKKTLKGAYRVLKPGGKIVLFEYTIADDKRFSEKDMRILDKHIENTVVLGLKEFRHDKFPKYLENLGFVDVKEQNITDNMLPSVKKLNNLAFIPYKFLKLFNIKNHFVNTQLAVDWYRLIKKGRVRYCIFTAQKKSL